MFSHSKYKDVTPCIRGNELLTSILDKTGVSKLWLNSEHIFLITKEDRNLYAFAVAPQLRWLRSVEVTPNDCLLDASLDPVLDVLWEKCKPSFVYVISETGTTNFWEFLRPSNEWIKHRTIQLSNAKGSQIIDVKLHEESRKLVWCERRGHAIDAYCVCYRSINIKKHNEKVNIEISATQALLHNCPVVNLFTFHNGICMHPSCIYLEKIFMFWTSGRGIQAVVIKEKKVQESVNNLPDFRDIATALIGSWAEDPDDDSFRWLGSMVQTSTGDLLLLHNTGALLKVTINSKIVKVSSVCILSLPLNITANSQQIKVFTNGLIVGLIDSKSIVFLYDIISGKLLQTFEEFSKFSEEVQVLETNSKHPVFWNSGGIWRLDSLPLNELVKTVTSTEYLNGKTTNEGEFHEESDVETKELLSETRTIEGLNVLDVVNWLCMFRLKHAAMVLLLEHVTSAMQKGQKLPETTMQLLKTLGKDVLQNPAILFTLFEDDLAFKEESRKELKQFLDEIDQATVPSEYMTPLNVRILPYLRELHERWNEELMLPSLDLSGLTKVLEESVCGVVDDAVKSVAAGTPDAVCLEKADVLSLQEPEEAVKAFVKDNEETFLLEGGDGMNVCTVLRAELQDRRWKRRRSPENATVIGIMFRLLYKKHPEMLLRVVDMAEKSLAEGASKDEATLEDIKDCVRDFVLDFLPNVWSEKECDLERIKIHAQLLLRLELHRDTLEIFLQRQLWHEAVEVYLDITRSSTDIPWVCQLYELLLAGLLRGTGTSQRELLTKVLELKPKMIKVRTLFELCLRNVPKSSMESVFHGECLTVGEAKKALEQFLPLS